MVYILLANGFEDIEAVAAADILRRSGLELQTVGIEGKTIKAANGINVVTDICIEDVDKSEMTMIVLPGGMPGAKTLAQSETVLDLIKYADKNGLIIGAICAAPIVLASAGILTGRKAVCYPGFENRLTGAIISSDSVVADGNIITAKGPGKAFDFSFKLVEAALGDDAANNVKKQMCC